MSDPSFEKSLFAPYSSFGTGGEYGLFPDVAQVTSFFAEILATENLSSESSALKDIANAIALGFTRFSQMVGYFGDICCPSQEDQFSQTVATWHQSYCFIQPLPMASLSGLSKFVGLSLIKTFLIHLRELICHPKTQKALLALGAASFLQFILGALTAKLAAMFSLSVLESMSASMLGLHTIGAAVGIRSFCSMTNEDLMREYAAKLMEP